MTTSTRVRDLIKILETKDQDAEVEFIVAKKDGELVCMAVEKNAKDIIKALKFFNRGD